MESAVANLCAPGDRVAVVGHGSFGERWLAICEQHELDVQAIRYEWGERPDPDEVGAAVRESGVDLVLCQQSDTSTGVVSDVRAIKEAVGDARLVVDAISSLGAVPLETDEWGIDVVVSGSQKALMAPPGLAMVSVPDAVLDRAKPSRSFYFDWQRNKKAQDAARRRVHAGGVADPQPRRGARPDLLEHGLEAGVRAPHPPRPRDPRRCEGDGSRALLARRRHGRRRDGDPRARRASTPTSCCCICATGTV